MRESSDDIHFHTTQPGLFRDARAQGVGAESARGLHLKNDWTYWYETWSTSRESQANHLM